jgi:hypothetical protein
MCLDRTTTTLTGRTSLVCEKSHKLGAGCVGAPRLGEFGRLPRARARLAKGLGDAGTRRGNHPTQACGRRKPVKGVKRPKVESYEGKTPMPAVVIPQVCEPH